MRTLFHTSIQLKRHVEEAAQHSSSSELWPPEAKHMSLEQAEKIVPVQLFNALAWIVGASSEVQVGSFVHVTDGDKKTTECVSGHSEHSS